MSGMPSRSFKEMINILQQFVNFSDMVVSDNVLYFTELLLYVFANFAKLNPTI